MEMYSEDSKYVFFDLETAGLLHLDPDILQIGAITANCSDSFDKFLKPTRTITNKNYEKTNNLIYDENSGKLYKRSQDGKTKKLCHTVDAKDGLLAFILWLNRIGSGSRVLLIAYNAFKFDACVLLKRLREHGLEQAFSNICRGFMDPLLVSRAFYKHLPSRRMEDMLKHFDLLANSGIQTHNAIQDANDLRRLTMKMAEDINLKENCRKSWKEHLAEYFIDVDKAVGLSKNAK
jgi:DNA polymerase III alpha subunit (gram-positive type)